jgi:hypothetical protein
MTGYLCSIGEGADGLSGFIVIDDIFIPWCVCRGGFAELDVGGVSAFVDIDAASRSVGVKVSSVKFES